MKAWVLDRKQSAKLMNIHDTFEAGQPVMVVVVVVVCSELTWPQVSSFNNANVTWVIIQDLMDLTAITCALLPQF